MAHAKRGQEGEPNADTGPTRDEVFDVLSNQRRRRTLRYLRQRDGEVDLTELSTQLCAWENDVAPADITYRDRKSVYTALQQTHLPKMNAVDIVDYDPETGVVELSPAFEPVDVSPELVSTNEVRRREYYLGLSAVSAALLLAVWLDIFPFTVLGDLAWAAIIVGLFAVPAAVDTCDKFERGSGGDGAPLDIPHR